MKINGTEWADELSGSAEADLLAGKGGDDILFGYLGDDRLWGGAGNDYVDGDEGNDTLYGREDADWMNGGAGWDILVGGKGDDGLFDPDWAIIDGGTGNDWIGLSNGTAYGRAGDDYFEMLSQPDPAAGASVWTGRGADVVACTFVADGIASSVTVEDFSAPDALTFRLLGPEGQDWADDATLKFLLDSDQDGALTDADTGPWYGWEVTGTQDGLVIQIGEDSVRLAGISAYDFA